MKTVVNVNSKKEVAFNTDEDPDTDETLATYVKNIEFPVGNTPEDAANELDGSYVILKDPVGTYTHGNIYLAYSVTDKRSVAFFDLDGTNAPDEKANEKPVTGVAILEGDAVSAGYEELLDVKVLNPNISNAKVVIVKRGE
jgi:hypothetical protein